MGSYHDIGAGQVPAPGLGGPLGRNQAGANSDRFAARLPDLTRVVPEAPAAPNMPGDLKDMASHDVGSRLDQMVAGLSDPFVPLVEDTTPPFEYQPYALRDLSPALALGGSISGIEANAVTVDAYGHFSKGFHDYLGHEPPVASWPTAGQFAARGVSTYIATAESGANMAIEAGEGDILGTIGAVGSAAWNSNYLLAASSLLSGQGFDEAIVGRQGLVAANVGIYQDFAPAFDHFLRAESLGLDGLQSFEAEVARGQFRDPSGLLTEAFGLYQQARQLYMESREDPGSAAPLLARREALVARANLLIGIHEQFHVVQPVFDDPELGALMASQSEGLVMEDARGAYPLLTGKNDSWGSFTDRMGLKEADRPASVRPNGDLDNDVFRVVDGQGQERFFRIKDDARGTISDYLLRSVSGDWARTNLAAEL